MHKIITNLKYIYIPFFSYQTGRNPKFDSILKQHSLLKNVQAGVHITAKGQDCLHVPLCGTRLQSLAKISDLGYGRPNPEVMLFGLHLHMTPSLGCALGT